MKILQLGKFWPVRGGVERVMADLMTGLSARGIDCDMMCAASAGRGSISVLSEHSSLITHRTWVKAASTTIAPSMVAQLKKVAPAYDIIHVHHPDPMAATALLLSGYKGRVVLHWHSDILKQKRLVRLYRPLQRWLIDRADVVIGTTPEYIRNSPDLAGAMSKIACVPIGVDAIEADPKGAEAIRALYAGRTIVYFMGRLIGYKGLEHLVDAARYLPDSYVILIGGDGPLRGALQQRIDDAGLAGKVVLLGRIEQHLVSAYYTACHVFCLPSVMKTEAFGIVQIEAMSLGKPVVATRIHGSGTAWVNSHGHSGLNVPVADPRAIADAIKAITADTDCYTRFCRGAEQRFNDNFRIDSMIDRCVDIYNNILK